MVRDDRLDIPWQPEQSTSWLGDVLLGAADSVFEELPELRLRPPGGFRGSPQKTAPGVQRPTAEEQTALVNPSSGRARKALGLIKARRAVVVLIDGLGWHNLMARADRAPFLINEFQRVKGQSALPSTTAANVTFLGTGVQPGQTAMAGYTVRNPETRERMNLISWAGGMNPLDWQRVPTVFERLSHAGVSSAHVSTWRFERSALTQAALRGANYVAAESLAERVEATADLMHTTDTPIAYLYWAEVDSAGHLYGWQTPEWENELRHVDEQLGRLVQLLPPDTLVVVTADHGMVDVPLGPSRVFGGEARIDISAHAALSEGLELVAGENRYLHLFTSEPEAVARRWRDFLGERALVQLREEAFDAGVYGPVRAEVADVVGDVTVAALGDISVADKRIVSEGMFNLAGLHGSVTEWDRAIPILSLVTG